MFPYYSGGCRYCQFHSGVAIITKISSWVYGPSYELNVDTNEGSVPSHFNTACKPSTDSLSVCSDVSIHLIEINQCYFRHIYCNVCYHNPNLDFCALKFCSYLAAVRVLGCIY